jgi:hypothetical protein
MVSHKEPPLLLIIGLWQLASPPLPAFPLVPPGKETYELMFLEAVEERIGRKPDPGGMDQS